MRLPIRAIAITLFDNKVLLMWRKKNGREFYVFPGGGVEEGETSEEAAKREIREETSIEVIIDRLLYHHHLLGDPPEKRESDQYFFLAKYVSGKPQLQQGTNEAASQESGEDFYKPLWVDTTKLSEIKLYPLEVRDWLISDLKSGFKEEVRSKTWIYSEMPK